ncbi:hypothetical protein QC764_109090 [Podospora pseudoanserina]|uniref:DOMON domain-containing protein n=1 Tax=Podospora pseudoanserina TaxID=2609844 RepID=A0ABR0IMM1_9PEZI|nr:hypothetical protein QC764_109090 [Podospora pseudoanserina]
MKRVGGKSLVASALLGASLVQADPQSICATDNICYSIAVPTSSASSNSGNIYFQLKAPTSYSWVALGTGSQMAGASIFVMYQDGNGNVTISPRLGTAHSQPQWDQSSTAAQLTLLAGSGVAGGIMTANVACANCESWNGGDMSLQGTSVPWIAAWRSGSSLATTNKGATISQHGGSDHTGFNIDLTTATISSDSNPFLTSRDTGGGDGSGSSSGSPAGGNGITLARGNPNAAAILAAHGVIGALVMAVLYPLGSLLMPLLGRWYVHGAWQVITFALMWAAFGLGVQSAKDRNMLFTQTHTILGTVVVAFFGVQPALGYIHHRQYVQTQSRGAVSYVHIWLGRILMLLGIINGGLGLRLVGERQELVIAYGVVSGVIFLCYILAKAFTVIGAQKAQGRSYKEDRVPGNMRRPYQESRRHGGRYA